MNKLINLYPDTKVKPSKGKLLLSEPFMEDPYFKRTVVLLCEHNDEGSFGFVLNKFIDIKVNEIMEDLPAFETKISIGGPVQNNNLYYIHTLGEAIEGSSQILDNVYMGGNFEILKIMLRAGEIQSDQIRFFVGYSGWTENQLNGELREKSWIVSNTDSNYLMSTNASNLWEQTLKSMGKEFAVLANFPEDPSLN